MKMTANSQIPAISCSNTKSMTDWCHGWRCCLFSWPKKVSRHHPKYGLADSTKDGGQRGDTLIDERFLGPWEVFWNCSCLSAKVVGVSLTVWIPSSCYFVTGLDLVIQEPWFWAEKAFRAKTLKRQIALWELPAAWSWRAWSAVCCLGITSQWNGQSCGFWQSNSWKLDN